VLNISTKFYPLRLTAFMRNNIEMEVLIENRSEEARWVECDVLVPDAISLAPDRTLTKGRIRLGIIASGEMLGKKVKVYAGASSYPDTYSIKLIAYGYGREGVIAEKSERKTELRCERIGGV
jgi:hypothetical protein